MNVPGNSEILAKPFTDHAVELFKNDWPKWPHYREIDSNSLPLYDMEEGTVVFDTVKSKIQETYPQINITKIQQVNAPQMYGMYLLRKEEMMANNSNDDVEEKVLYHATMESNADESLENGLDWRRIRRFLFGRGVSFSVDADYTIFNRLGYTDVIIVCNVLMKNIYQVPGYQDLGRTIEVPPGLADTTMSNDGYVYVKYHDYDFYPRYFVHYQQ